MSNILIIFGALISQISFFIQTNDFETDDVYGIGKQIKFYNNLIEGDNLEKYLMKEDDKKIKFNNTMFSNNSNDNDLQKFINYIYEKWKNKDMKNDIYIECYAGYLLLKDEKK